MRPEPIYLHDGSICTSAGTTAGIDLSLALVEEDHGHETALKIARFLVMVLVRPGGQAQYSHMLRIRHHLKAIARASGMEPPARS